MPISQNAQRALAPYNLSPHSDPIKALALIHSYRNDIKPSNPLASPIAQRLDVIKQRRDANRVEDAYIAKILPRLELNKRVRAIVETGVDPNGDAEFARRILERDFQMFDTPTERKLDMKG